MWTVPKKSSASIPGVVEKQIEDVMAGEIFSINPKARRFVLDTIDPNGMITAHITSGQSFSMPYRDYQGRFVMVWGEESGEDFSTRKFEIFDRVKHIKNGKMGTIIQLQETKNVDKDIVVLWDEPNDGEWETEVHSGEIIYLGEQATGSQLELAQEAIPLVREQQIEHEKGYEDKTRQIVQDELAKRSAKREEFKNQLEQKNHQEASKMANQVISKHAGEFRMIVQSGLLAITAGENNYEIDVIAEIVDGYMDSIMHKVSSVVAIPDMRIPVSVEVMNIVAKSMLDEYLFTREGFVRPKNGKWLVYSKHGKVIGGPFGNKERAVRHIRHAEWRKRQGMEEMI